MVLPRVVAALLNYSEGMKHRPCQYLFGASPRDSRGVETRESALSQAKYLTLLLYVLTVGYLSGSLYLLSGLIGNINTNSLTFGVFDSICYGKLKLDFHTAKN